MKFRTLLRVSLIASVLAFVGVPLQAQTTLNSTTANGAITATQQVITLTAVTNISAGSRNLGGDLILLDRELAQVNAVDTTAKTVTVTRGTASTQAATHATGIVVWTAPRQRFYQNRVAGSCTATSEAFLPHITLPSSGIPGVEVYDCINSLWTKLKADGYIFAAGLVDSTSTVSGTVQTTEFVVNSVTIPATEFAGARGVRCVAWGTGAANANAKNYKFYFGATAVSTLTGTTDNAKDYLGEIVVLRTGASTQAGYGAITSDIGAPDSFAVTTALAESETAAIVVSFKTANTAAAAASATGKGLYCHWLP